MPLFSMHLAARSTRRLLAFAAAASLVAFPARSAHALQPLSDFLDHAKTWNPDNRAAAATVDQRDAEVGVSNGNLEPNLQFNGLYTRNQYDVTTGSLFGGGSTSTAGLSLVLKLAHAPVASAGVCEPGPYTPTPRNCW